MKVFADNEDYTQAIRERFPEPSPRLLTDPKPANPIEWPDPTPELLATPEFEAIWQCIKRWDINVPEAYAGYSGATGNHVRAILDALAKLKVTG